MNHFFLEWETRVNYLSRNGQIIDTFLIVREKNSILNEWFIFSSELGFVSGFLIDKFSVDRNPNLGCPTDHYKEEKGSYHHNLSGLAANVRILTLYLFLATDSVIISRFMLSAANKACLLSYLFWFVKWQTGVEMCSRLQSYRWEWTLLDRIPGQLRIILNVIKWTCSQESTLESPLLVI